MDEDNTVQAENTEAVEDNSPDTSPVDETTTSESSEQQPDTDGETSSAEESNDETQGGESEDTERKPSRAERRIRQQNQKIRDLQAKLEQQGNPLYSQAANLGQQPPQRMFEDGQEYTAQDLEQRMVQAANNIASLQTQGQVETLRAQLNLEKDIDVLPKEYAELDESSDDYVPELTESIIEEYQSRAFQDGRVNTSVRLADIAKRHVNAVRSAAKKSEAKMKNRVASTADTAAIKPTKPTKETKPISEMTSAEIEEMMKSQGKYIKA